VESRELSAPQLAWIHDRLERRQVQRDLRLLAITAAGNVGGNAAGELAEEFARELRQFEGGPARDQAPKSQMPMSAEQFKQMIEEQHGT
jgi:hypothetical protein